jgi:two-component system, OmpR family, alkaline phosphatase synthesis response regulator PhoP
VKPRGRVLIVDDEPDILLMLRVNLEGEGFSTALAGDGETALRRIEEERPDVVLLDVMMPVMDGWGVLAGLHRLDPRPRILVLSAKSGARDMAKAYELGADEYVTKPFDPDELIRSIEMLLSMDLLALDARRRSQAQRYESHVTG